MSGKKIFKLIEKIWNYNRSIAGPENNKTLYELKKINNKLKVNSFKSGAKVGSWTIPKEWSVKSAWIKNLNGDKVIDISDNNLHIINYSIKVKKKKISSVKLKKKIYTIPNRPNTIPYITSYYKKDWGFCMSYNQLKKMNDKFYNISLDSLHKKGKMSYGEIFLKGRSKKEILITTYICHPSMANNELSGPSLVIYLSKWLCSKKRYYSYRLLFLPETIGAIAYIKKNILELKKNVIGGFVVTCVGDEKNYSFLPSKYENSIIDKITENVLKNNKVKYKKYSWLQRGSDERQYNWPNVDLKICSLMRSKYHVYPEYHTSDDVLNKVVTKRGLNQSYNIYKKIIKQIEASRFPISNTLGEPFLSKLNLYPKIGNYYTKTKKKILSKQILNFLSYSDGNNSNEEILSICKIDISTSKRLINLLKRKKLINYI
tara:strand:- start:384 stop:1673 length:1290 start_codon:yes stop_codon:yes gene_type:complete